VQNAADIVPSAQAATRAAVVCGQKRDAQAATRVAVVAVKKETHRLPPGRPLCAVKKKRTVRGFEKHIRG